MEKNLESINSKSLAVFLLIIALAVFNKSVAQELIPLEVSQHKAVHLMFPGNVKYCASGSENVGYEVTDNIVKLIAKKQGFPETNLTVITEGDVIFSFLLIFNKDPRKLNLIVEEKRGKFIDGKVPDDLSVSTTTLPAGSTKDIKLSVEENGSSLNSPSNSDTGPLEEKFNAICIEMIQNEKSVPVADLSNSVGLEIYNIYEYDGHHYFSMYAYNESEKPFKVDIVNFQQADKNWAFGKVYREGLKKPVYVFNEKDVFNVNGKHHIVYVFEKLNIEEDKKFLIEMGAEDGKRMLSLEVPEKYINEAPVFKEVK